MPDFPSLNLTPPVGGGSAINPAGMMQVALRAQELQAELEDRRQSGEALSALAQVQSAGDLGQTQAKLSSLLAGGDSTGKPWGPAAGKIFHAVGQQLGGATANKAALGDWQDVLTKRMERVLPGQTTGIPGTVAPSPPEPDSRGILPPSPQGEGVIGGGPVTAGSTGGVPFSEVRQPGPPTFPPERPGQRARNDATGEQFVAGEGGWAPVAAPPQAPPVPSYRERIGAGTATTPDQTVASRELRDPMDMLSKMGEFKLSHPFVSDDFMKEMGSTLRTVLANPRYQKSVVTNPDGTTGVLSFDVHRPGYQYYDLNRGRVWDEKTTLSVLTDPNQPQDIKSQAADARARIEREKHAFVPIPLGDYAPLGGKFDPLTGESTLFQGNGQPIARRFNPTELEGIARSGKIISQGQVVDAPKPILDYARAYRQGAKEDAIDVGSAVAGAKTAEEAKAKLQEPLFQTGQAGTVVDTKTQSITTLGPTGKALTGQDLLDDPQRYRPYKTFTQADGVVAYPKLMAGMDKMAPLFDQLFSDVAVGNFIVDKYGNYLPRDPAAQKAWGQYKELLPDVTMQFNRVVNGQASRTNQQQVQLMLDALKAGPVASRKAAFDTMRELADTSYRSYSGFEPPPRSSAGPASAAPTAPSKPPGWKPIQ